MTLDRRELLDIIRRENPEGLDIPKDASIFIQVPTGGDYSGCTLFIDGKDVIELTWEDTQ